MPLYEFRCQTCGVFDQWRTMAECHQPATCPTCNQEAKRIISPPAVQLSGSFRLRQEKSEPELVQRHVPEPKPSQPRSHTGGRPWMLGH
ncbi:FmdB family zinc ribbon protein [Pantanalinema rosaneae CENA516]|uniref:FmdB family zinc ribbon protein n=1 Tax=Pantanalinema rosaneae TaxID=1620701 RepID=UPI003D6E0E4C